MENTSDLSDYLGDGVYATFDGYHIWLDLRAQGHFGVGPSGYEGVALEPPVLKALDRFRERIAALYATV